MRHLHPPSPLFFGPLAETPRVGSVGPEQLHLRQLPLQLVGQEPSRAVPVVQAGSVDVGAEHEAAGVHEQVALPACEALGSIVTALGSSCPGALDRLAVDHRPAWVAVASFRLAHRLTKPVVSLAQPPVSAPLPEVVVDRLPRRVLSRKHPPGAAGAQQVEDGVGYAPGRPLRWTATPFGRLEQRLQQGPFGVGKVGGVRMTSARHDDLRDLG